MLNDKVLKSVAEAVNKVMAEALKGDQHKIDKNKNNKIDAQDFKILRKEETLKEEDAYGKDRYAVKNGKAIKDNPTHMGSANYKDQAHHVWAKSAEEALKKKSVKEETVTEEEKKKSPFDWKTPREPEVKGGAGVKAGRAYGGAAQKSKPEQDDAKDTIKMSRVNKTERALDVKWNREKKRGGSIDLGEEASQEEFNKEIKKAQAKSEGKNDADVAKPAVQAVQQEEVEQLEERSLTSGEKAEVEKNVKGMKKNLAGFKERYGKDAKSVMYATATKQAKGE